MLTREQLTSLCESVTQHLLALYEWCLATEDVDWLFLLTWIQISLWSSYILLISSPEQNKAASSNPILGFFESAGSSDRPKKKPTTTTTQKVAFEIAAYTC